MKGHTVPLNINMLPAESRSSLQSHIENKIIKEGTPKGLRGKINLCFYDLFIYKGQVLSNGNLEDNNHSRSITI